MGSCYIAFYKYLGPRKPASSQCAAWLTATFLGAEHYFPTMTTMHSYNSSDK